MTKPIAVGAVMYDPKVSVIWDIIGQYFHDNECEINAVFYANYDLQVDALIKGKIDVAWNSPLAWLETKRRMPGHARAIAMRDTDRNRQTHLIVEKGSKVTNLMGLRDKVVALGAEDSPQATLIPLGMLYRAGLEPDRDFRVQRFDVMVGKHGDHIGGEREAFNCLARRDAAASAILDLNWQTWIADGTIDPQKFRILKSTDKFDHCVFTATETLSSENRTRFLNVLFSMSYDNPEHRKMMDLEGLKSWLPGRTSGFGALTEAVERLGYFSGRDK